MILRYNIINEMFGNKDLSNAVAFSLYIKERNSSCIQNCTINKLRQITKMSAEAIKKRLNTLLLYGLAEYQGKEKKCLVLKRLKSTSKLRNVLFPSLPHAFSKVKEAEKYIRAALIMAVQQRKDYVRHLLSADGIHSAKEVKQCRRSVANLGLRPQYCENGLSYKGIAKKIGVSVKTAFETVKFAIKNGLITKIKHIIQILCPNIKKYGVSFSDVSLYPNHFVTKNALYLCFANTYQINSL